MFKKLVTISVIIAVLFAIMYIASAKNIFNDSRHGAQKKILMVIAPKDFKDQELFETKEIFESHGAKVTVASTTKETATGMDGKIYTPDIIISDVKVEKYNAVVLVGGMGVTETLWIDKDLKELLIEADNQNKLLAAICLAPVAIAKAGLLYGKTATMYPWDEAIKELTDCNVKYLDQEVVVEGNIITGKNPEASKAFALEIVNTLGLKEKEKGK